MRIGIVGGGIGGLSLGLALARHGLSAHVHERSPHPGSGGAGIVLSLNGFEVMKRLGLGDAALRLGRRIKMVRIVDAEFETLSELSLAPLEERFQSYMVGIERRVLHHLLLEPFGEDNFSRGDKCVAVDEKEGPLTARFQSGKTAAYDLLVAADGLHSKLRQGIFPLSLPRYTGQTSWRGIASWELDKPWQNISWEAWGEGKRFGLVELPEGKVYWYAVEKAKAGGHESPECAKAKLSAAFKNFHPIVTAVVEATPPEAIVRTDISDLKPLTRWHQGRMVLLGDAAHATSPNLGQGGNQALEDAWCLAALLAKNLPLETALCRFEDYRLRKANQIIRDSRLFGKVAHLDSPPLVFLRNTALKLMPSGATARRLAKIATLHGPTE